MRVSLMTRELDPRMTFETFVVGPANRLAAAAARRAADSPGTSYNPLFIYSPSGLGKSHILSAIAHHGGRGHADVRVVYQTMEGYLEELTTALEEGERDRLKEEYSELDILLLDDVQFLSGQPEAQELLLRTLDSLTVSGSQIVLAGDRPPAEINGLDERLLSRFSGGLIVDISAPEFETRVAITRRKAEERGASLQDGVAEAIARHPFRNVRELAGALNRVLAVQDLEERIVEEDEVAALVGFEDASQKRSGGDEFGTFVSEVSTDLESSVAQREAQWRVEVREARDEADAAGFRTARLERLLELDEEPENVEDVLQDFHRAVARLTEIAAELEEVGNPWSDAAATVLKDPERVDEAEALLASARERARPFPTIPDGPLLADLEGKLPPLAVKAAGQLVGEGQTAYNPLFVWDPQGVAATALLEATARSFAERGAEGRAALISTSAFAEEFIQALSAGVAGAWRERWWDVDLLLVHGLEDLSRTERAQDEFFHLFEALKRREARIMLAADRAPSGIENVDDRLRSRFEGGLVIELEDVDPRGATPSAGEARAMSGSESIVPSLGTPETSGASDRAGSMADPSPADPTRGSGPSGAPRAAEAGQESHRGEDAGRESAPFSAEKVVWEWPHLDDRIVDA